MRLVSPPVPLSLRGSVIGQLVESDDPADKSQDMVSLPLTGGVLVHAGWYPDSDPNGCYKVTVTRGLRYLCPPVTSRDVDQAAEDFAELTAMYHIKPKFSIVYETDYETRTCYPPRLVAAH